MATARARSRACPVPTTLGGGRKSPRIGSETHGRRHRCVTLAFASSSFGSANWWTKRWSRAAYDVYYSPLIARRFLLATGLYAVCAKSGGSDQLHTSSVAASGLNSMPQRNAEVSICSCLDSAHGERSQGPLSRAPETITDLPRRKGGHVLITLCHVVSRVAFEHHRGPVAYSDLIRSAFRRHSISVPSSESIRSEFRTIRSAIPLIRSPIPVIRSGLADRLTREAGMVAAHEATVHAQDSRGSSSSPRVWLPTPPDCAGMRVVALDGVRLLGPRRAGRADVGASQVAQRR
jgi:hypothetical protein